MDVKKMVSFCKSTLFFIRGKREVDMSPLSSNAFRSTKTKNDIHACGNNTTHSHRPVRRAARPTKKPLFSPSWVVPFAGRRRGPDETLLTSIPSSRIAHFFSSRLLRFFFDDDDSDAMKWRPRRRHSRRPKAPRDVCHYQRETKPTTTFVVVAKVVDLHTTRTTRDYAH